MRKPVRSVLSWIDAAMAASAHGFIDFWTRVERTYKRPLAGFAYRLRFAFYPLLALGAIAWLGWDWTHGRSLDAAEDAVFDEVIQHLQLLYGSPEWRPHGDAMSELVLTLLSLIFPFTARDTDTATQVALALSHVVAAAIVIPALASRLSD